ncbi:putative pterin-binding protein [Ancylobacter lacus]|uniref:hypothetical protein n=1 Tax=Ancylobacter lacus TaxID=2579970 RepID=UPI001BCFA46A|nr:hypothetical protein [Ancylobacter lacus]MBS7538415.1 hypothetical protein [Ancylobacter lacus]
MMKLFRRIAIVVALFSSTLSGAFAADLNLRWLDAKGAVTAERMLSLADIDKLAQVKIDTSTPWTSGLQHFRGPTISTLAALAPGKVASATVIAINDYAVTLPSAAWEKYGPILATRLNDQTMRVRDKGPFWVMFPIDSDPELAEQHYQSLMVWQVKQIDFITD